MGWQGNVAQRPQRHIETVQIALRNLYSLFVLAAFMHDYEPRHHEPHHQKFYMLLIMHISLLVHDSTYSQDTVHAPKDSLFGSSWITHFLKALCLAVCCAYILSQLRITTGKTHLLL